VLLRTRAQGALIGSGAAGLVAALREVLGQLLQYEQPLRHLINGNDGLRHALTTWFGAPDAGLCYVTSRPARPAVAIGTPLVSCGRIVPARQGQPRAAVRVEQH